jgi:hypothetical protein
MHRRYLWNDVIEHRSAFHREIDLNARNFAFDKEPEDDVILLKSALNFEFV